MTPDVCPHTETEAIGRQGDAWFERCRDCGRLLILQRGRAWVLRPRLPAA